MDIHKVVVFCGSSLGFNKIYEEKAIALGDYFAVNNIELLYGENDHHMVEAIFKGLGRSLKMATKKSGKDLPSTKGVL